jgi:peptide-methionine (S)-S-oxide reductase
MSTERAVLAAGCFWGTQDLLRKIPGVTRTRTGYAGDPTFKDATYTNHGDHAESVEIIFDPAKLSYRTLLECFFQMHDPTTLNQQGSDVGRDYRSIIFYETPEQEAIARATVADVDASGIWPGPIVTLVQPLDEFWLAEDEHQDYLQLNPLGYTCHYIRPDWHLPNLHTQSAR